MNTKLPTQKELIGFVIGGVTILHRIIKYHDPVTLTEAADNTTVAVNITDMRPSTSNISATIDLRLSEN